MCVVCVRACTRARVYVCVFAHAYVLHVLMYYAFMIMYHTHAHALLRVGKHAVLCSNIDFVEMFSGACGMTWEGYCDYKTCVIWSIHGLKFQEVYSCNLIGGHFVLFLDGLVHVAQSKTEFMSLHYLGDNVTIELNQ